MVKSRRKHEKCIRCDIIPCINLYKRRGNEEIEGGELYVLQQVIDKKLHFPCETGALLQVICKLTELYMDIDLPSFYLFLQCLRDLKASVFLLLTAHYRNSLQLLRPVIENYLVGLYFDWKILLAKNDEKRKIWQNFNDFWEEKYEIPETEWKEINPNEEKRKKLLDYDFCLRWLIKKGVVKGKIGSKLQKKIGELNRYLHPAFKHTEIGKPDCTSCPTDVRYDEKEYKKTVTLFQDIITLIIDALGFYISQFLSEKTNEMEEELKVFVALRDLEKETKRQLIYSRELANLISRLTP